MPGSPWLILPTFDEAENLEPIVAAALAVLRAAAPGRASASWSSTTTRPTAPARIADRLAAEHDDVEVLHRHGARGLGPAYLAGFAHALEGGAATSSRWTPTSRTTPPTSRACWPRARRRRRPRAGLALRARRRGCADWGLLRRIVSRGGSLYARRCSASTCAT